MSNERKNYYQALENGTLVVIEGNLGSDPEIREGENYTIASLSIAVKAGSQKDDSGNYKDITHWRKLSIFDNGGNSSAFIEFLKNPSSEKMAFRKGNRVKFIGYLGVPEVAEGKYINEKVVELLTVKRVLTGGKRGSNAPSEEDTPVATKPVASNSTTDDIPF